MSFLLQLVTLLLDSHLLEHFHIIYILSKITHFLCLNYLLV